MQPAPSRPMLPVARHRLITARQFSTPLEWCSMPRAWSANRALRLAEPARGLLDGLRRHAGDRRRALGSQACTDAATASKPVVCAAMNSRSSRPSRRMTCSMPMSSGESVPGPHRQVQVGVAGDRRHARVDDDQLPAVVAAPPEIVGGDRRALGDVGARRRSTTSPCGMSLHGIGRAVDAEGQLVGRARGDHAEPAVVVDVARAQRRRARTCRAGTPSRW